MVYILGMSLLAAASLVALIVKGVAFP